MEIEFDYIKLGHLYLKAEHLQRLESYKKDNMIEPFYLELMVLGEIHTLTFETKSERDYIFMKLAQCIEDEFDVLDVEAIKDEFSILNSDLQKRG